MESTSLLEGQNSGSSPAESPEDAAGRSFLARFAKATLALLAFLVLIAAPYSAWWLYESGDCAVERACAMQADGEFALFGSGVSQDFVDYKLQLYARVKPRIAAIGSSRVMQFRRACFAPDARFLNMGGVAGNLKILRSTLDAMLKVHEPEAVIIGLDFWWFMPRWEARPNDPAEPTSGSYSLRLASLKQPWTWLMEGKISFAELARPLAGLFGQGFRRDRFGIMAQQTSDGFGPDGAWYYTGDVTGRKRPYDYQFQATLDEARHGIKAFYHARPGEEAPAQDHLDALCGIVHRLQSRGIKAYVFIAPLSERVLAFMRTRPEAYRHLFRLREALLARGIDALDCTDAKAFGSSDCEFVDGFHGGEVTYARILRLLAERHPSLAPCVDRERIAEVLAQWEGFALVPDPRVTSLPEIDFMHFGCPKAARR